MQRKLRLLPFKVLKKILTPAHEIKTDFKGQAASDEIFKLLSADKPCMISRFGSVELDAVCRVISYSAEGNFFSKAKKYLNDEIFDFLPAASDWTELHINAGFFPVSAENVKKFAELYLSCIPEIDILGSWLETEKYVGTYFNQTCKRIPLRDLEPYYAGNPWSRILQSKKVLVIHPFSETIKKQYEKKEYLFQNKNVLPEFSLKTIKAVQSIAGTKTEYNSWFDALEAMKKQIDAADFDIAIIGCGAYGMPLAAYCKQIGKKAVHLGGATQLLFGIKGKRWDNYSLYNDYWVRPLESETPRNAGKIESGCYW